VERIFIHRGGVITNRCLVKVLTVLDKMSDVSEEQLLENLKKYFKHTRFKSDTQKNAIKNILRGKFFGNENFHNISS
jgi:hypothetical protein